MPPPSDERLARVTSASLSDAVRRIHPHRAHVLDLVTPTPGRVLFGRAATMQFVPQRADAAEHGDFGFGRVYRAAVGDAPAGKVVVMAVAGETEGAVAGGKRLAELEVDRVAGLLTNARLRDFHEVRGYAFAAYCRGETPFAGSAQIMPVAADVPVALDGATVMPGDFVYADAAGAVVVPAASWDAALDAAVAVEESDAVSVAKVLGRK